MITTLGYITRRNIITKFHNRNVSSTTHIRRIRDKSTPDNILKEFINEMDWIHNQLDMEEYCKRFLEVCNKIGGI